MMTHNLLLRTMFDRLPAQTQQQMVQKETMAKMADGHGMHINRSIRLNADPGVFHLEQTFWHVRIFDDVILEMKIVSQQDCSVACDKRLLVMADESWQDGSSTEL